MPDLVAIDAVDPVTIEQLLDRAFGADRHQRTAYKVRGHARAIGELSFAAVERDELLGTIQCWPVELRADDGAVHPLVMVGPVAVEPARQQAGLGRELTRHMLSVAAAGGADDAMMLIGDREYYGRFFGFSAERTSGWRLPGPVERHRLLARGAGVPAVSGMLGPLVARG